MQNDRFFKKQVSCNKVVLIATEIFNFISWIAFKIVSNMFSLVNPEDINEKWCCTDNMTFLFTVSVVYYSVDIKQYIRGFSARPRIVWKRAEKWRQGRNGCATHAQPTGNYVCSCTYKWWTRQSNLDSILTNLPYDSTY